MYIKYFCSIALIISLSIYHIHAQEQSDSVRETVKRKLDSIIVSPTGYLNVPSPQLLSKADSINKQKSLSNDELRDTTSEKSVSDVTDIPPGAKDTTTLSFKDTDIRDIFRGLSIQHGLNIFLDNSINKRVTISLMSVRVYDAIKFLCEQNNLLLNLEGGIFKIAPPPPPKEEPPPPPKPPTVSYDNHLLSVQLKNDDLERVVLEIQKKTGFNILLLNGTTGTITGTLNNIEFENGFTQLLNNNGFAVQKKNGVFIVSRMDYFVGTQSGNQQKPTGPYWVSVKDSLVSLDVTNAPLDRVVSDIVKQCNSDVVFYNSLSGTLSIRATNIPFSKALDLMLKNTNFTYRESEGTYFIGERANKSLAVTKLIKLKHLRADKVMEMIPQAISSQAMVKAVKEHNGLVIIASSDVIEQMKEFLLQVDKPIAQVLIEALVVDFDRTKGSEFGIEAGLLGSPDTTGIARSGSLVPGINGGATGPWLNRRFEKIGHVNLFGTDINVASLGVLPADFYMQVKALEQRGIANIKSRPLLATVNGQQASLSIGTTQYFLLKTTTPYRDQTQVVFQESQTFQTIEADVKLEITPYVGADSMITVDIKPDFRTPVGQLSSNVPPTINRRALSSTVVVKDGETIMLGGLIEEGETEQRSQVPILGSIPLLGDLFSSTTKSNHKTELIIYVTPHISFGEAFQNVSLPEHGN